MQIHHSGDSLLNFKMEVVLQPFKFTDYTCLYSNPLLCWVLVASVPFIAMLLWYTVNFTSENPFAYTWSEFGVIPTLRTVFVLSIETCFEKVPG